MRRVALTLFAFAALLAATGSVSACSCAPGPTAASILASSTVVFTATVADTKEIRKYVSVTTFRITESFKGPAAGATVKVLHPSGPSATCGVKFVAGQTYTLALIALSPKKTARP